MMMRFVMGGGARGGSHRRPRKPACDQGFSLVFQLLRPCRPGGNVVVDAFMPRILDDLAPLLTGSPVIVTATHAHPDHISGAPALIARHDAEMHVPATTLTYLDGDTVP